MTENETDFPADGELVPPYVPEPTPAPTEEEIAAQQAAAQEAADAYFEDKRIMAISTKLLGLHYDTAIGQAELLKYHVDEAIAKVKQSVIDEGMEMIEDIGIKIRVAVMVRPKTPVEEVE